MSQEKDKLVEGGRKTLEGVLSSLDQKLRMKLTFSSCQTNWCLLSGRF